MANFDVIGAVELTMSAAIMVAGLSVLAGRDAGERLRYSAMLLGWFVIVVILAATGALGNEHGIGAPGLGIAVAAPIVLIWVGLMRVQSLRSAIEVAPLSVLVGLHVVRVLGVSFLVLEASGRLPAPFAPAAGWGDIVAGLAAAPVAWIVYRRAKGWRTALTVWNLFGIADLVVAVSLGVLSSPGPLRRIFAEPGAGLMTSLPWLLIPGFLVPLLVTVHLVIFFRIVREGTRGGIPHGSAARLSSPKSVGV